MALPELIANDPVPGTPTALTTVQTAINTSVTTLKTNAAAPAALQGSGQFRIIIGSEILLVTAGAATTTWTVARAQEGSTAASHAIGASIFHNLTAEALRNLAVSLAQLPSWVVTAKRATPVSVSGNFTPDLKEGQRVFPVTMTGNLAVQTPTNTPAAPTVTEILLVLTQDSTGSRTVSYPGASGTRGGSAPEVKPAPGEVTEVVLSSEDGSTWHVIGEAELPSGVVTTASSPAAGKLAGFTGTGTAVEPVAAPVSGISEGQAETLIKALAILSNGYSMTVTTKSPGAGYVPLTTSTTTSEYILLEQEIILLAARRLTRGADITKTTVMGNGAAESNKIYRITKAAAKVTLPSGGVTLEGQRLVFINTASAVVELEGAIGGTEPASQKLQPGAVVMLWGSAGASEWEVLTLFTPVAAWTGLTLVGTKVEQTAGFYAHGARMEAAGTVLRLRGVLTAKTNIGVTTKFATLPSAVTNPTSNVTLPTRDNVTGALIPITLNTSGELKTIAEITSTTTLSLDGLSLAVA